MAPLREHSSWDKRYETDKPEIEPSRKYYIIAEGSNTELFYFSSLVDKFKNQRINNVEIIYLNKEGEIETHSHPKNLLEFINDKRKEKFDSGEFDKERDKFVIIFDRDSFRKPEEYLKYVDKAGNENILGVTNPSFELWLILHSENSFEKYIRKNEHKILENKKEKGKRYICKLFSEVFDGMDSKTNEKGIRKLVEFTDIAISQERKLCQDKVKLADCIGSNVGILIEEIGKNSLDLILKTLRLFK